MREKKVRELIHVCIDHHEMNEHKYRRLYSGGERGTTDVTKDEVIDLILEHLGMEVHEFAPRRAELVKIEDEEPS